MTQQPAAALRALNLGFVAPRCVHVVAELGVADALGEAPSTAAELAAATGCDADSLGRILRLLAAEGVFAEEGEGWVHTPISRLLRSDHPQSMRAMARRIGSEVNWAAYGALAHSARTGETAAETIVPGGLWAYYAANPEAGELFNASMAAKAHADTAAVLKAYDFSGIATFADIGGGRGHLLRAVLDAVPGATGVLFDQPHVIADAVDSTSGRLRMQGGSFFTDALPEADAYLLMNVIHDWGGAESGLILRAVRTAAPAGARILLIESVVPDGSGRHLSKVMDVHMLALTGGRERTLAQYAELLAGAGLRLDRLVPTESSVSVIEASLA